MKAYSDIAPRTIDDCMSAFSGGIARRQRGTKANSDNLQRLICRIDTEFVF